MCTQSHERAREDARAHNHTSVRVRMHVHQSLLQLPYVHHTYILFQVTANLKHKMYGYGRLYTQNVCFQAT